MTFRLCEVVLILATVGLLVGDSNCSDVDGDWSPWSMFNSPCNATCDGGHQTSYRSCSSPAPQGNGQLCTKNDTTKGTFEETTIECNTQSCFEGMWSNWTECDNCTVGKRFKESICAYGSCLPTEDRYEKVEEDCNRWINGICPSPCLKAVCPEYGVCKDISDEEGPRTKCVCTMNRKMNDAGTTCVRPPPTTPKPREIPTLAPAQKTVATVMSKTASVVLIAFVTATLIVFLVLRVFTPDRVIQMNMEIALLSAHVFLMFPPSIVEIPFLCKLVSIMIHLCFLACFMFMMLEALHMYFLVAYVVKKDGAFSRLQNILVGWGISIIIIFLCICFNYEDYGGEYHCWLQLDSGLVYGVFIPIICTIIITFTLTEAAGAANYKPVPDYDRRQRFSAKISQRTNLIILPFIVAHWIIGMFSEYEQNLPLYGTFAILNGFTGFFVFFFHCSNNNQVRDKLRVAYKNMSSGDSV